MRAKLHFRNLYHRPLPGVPFTYGIPLPQGIVRKPDQIALLDAAGRAAPLSAQPLATWPDGSIRWALLDFCGDFAPSEKAEWTIALDEGVQTPPPAQPVRVEVSNGVPKRGAPKADTPALGTPPSRLGAPPDASGLEPLDQGDSEIRVSNGPLEAVFRRDRFGVFESLQADGVELIRGGRSDIVAVSPAGKIFRASYDPRPRLSLEDVTPLRAVVRWDGGLFAGDGSRLTEFRLKLHFFAGNPYVKVEHSAVCRETPEKGVMIREYRIDLELLAGRAATKVVRQKIHDVDNFSRLVELKQNVHVMATPPPQGAVQSPAGTVVLEDESAFAENTAGFPHFLRPGAPRLVLGGGYGVVYPFLGLADERGTVVASFLRMSPQYPKGVAADEDRLSFEVWPERSGEWRLARGMTKTHHLALSFFGRRLSPEEIDNEAVRREFFAGQAQDPVEVTLDTDYARSTGQAESDRLLPYLPQKYPRLETKFAALQLHGRPLAVSGMMDYGEAIATNNEEDQGHEYAMEYYRRGSYEHYQKLVAQMLHNSTVDVVDWDPDPLRQGGTPYHTGYHQDAVCVPSHTWTEGMFEYAYVTGDREAFRAAVGICEWILRYMKGKPQIVKQDGREIGWPIIALVAGYQATWDKRYLDGAFELVDYYRERIARYGELLNSEPPGTGYCLTGYGEYAGFEGMHKLWRVTRDQEPFGSELRAELLRGFAVACMTQTLEAGYLNFTSPVGRAMDMYAVYALWDMTRDAQWLDLAKRCLPIVLGRPNWDGYFYRRIIHYLGLCHEQGWIDDNLVTLKD